MVLNVVKFNLNARDLWKRGRTFYIFPGYVQNTETRSPDIPEKALRIELANALIHGFGILFAVANIPLITAISTGVNNVPAIVGAAVYAFNFTMLFVFSTLCHAVQHPTAKHMLKVCDHISIYFLIAGTYTPFLLIYLLNGFGIALSQSSGSRHSRHSLQNPFRRQLKLLSTLIYT